MDAKTALQELIAEAIAAGYLDPDTLEPEQRPAPAKPVEPTRKTLGQIVLDIDARYVEAVRTGIWPKVPAWSQPQEQPKRRARKPPTDTSINDAAL
jgi:hypothetical protein